MAPKSSIIAKAVKKTFNEIGTLFPKRDNTPREKAMSVADGIAHPFNVVRDPRRNAQPIATTMELLIKG